MSLLLLALACAPDPAGSAASPLGGPMYAAPPGPPPPELVVGELVAGQPFPVALLGLPTGAPAALFTGPHGVTCLPSGPCLGLAPATRLRQGLGDPLGIAAWAIAVPPGAAGATSLQGAWQGPTSPDVTGRIDLQVTAGSVCGGAPAALYNPDLELMPLSPWTTSAPPARSMEAALGAWSIEVLGLVSVEQGFPPVQLSDLIEASFWSWHDPTETPSMRIEWSYDDGSVDAVTLTGGLDGWQQHDLLPLLDPAQALVRLRVWGYTGGGPGADRTRLDGFALCRGP